MIDSIPEKTNSIFGAGDFTEAATEKEDPAFVLTGINLINTRKLTWRQILELRKDHNALKNLRRLRTFIFENYNNKPLSFIQGNLRHNSVEVRERYGAFFPGYNLVPMDKLMNAYILSTEGAVNGKIIKVYS